jgi:hypothetical protein
VQREAKGEAERGWAAKIKAGVGVFSVMAMGEGVFAETFCGR